MTRVLHVAESFGGGVATAMSEYLRSTSELEHHLLYGRRAQLTPDLLEPYASATELTSARAAIGAVRRAVAKVRPDVVHAHSSFAGAYVRLAMRRGRPRVVYTPHCFAFERRDIGVPVRMGYRAAERLLALNTDVIAGCSRYERDLGASWIGAERAVYLPNIARCDDVPDAPGARRRVVGLGRLDPQKDPMWFADAAGRITSDAELLWIGGGDESVAAQLRERGVEVTGWVPRGEALALLAGARVYLQSSAWEGFPMAILESSALGVPAVIRQLQAVPESPRELTAADPAAAAEIVNRLLDEPAAHDDAVRQWHEALAENNPQTQRERLLTAYGIDPSGQVDD